MSTATVVRPEKDHIEIILSDWAGVILGGCRGSTTLNLIDLKGNRANRTVVEKAISSSDLVLYFGHGSKDKIGNPNAIFDNVNIYHCSGKILIAVACDVAFELGQKAIKNGAKSFLGFDDELVVYLGKLSLFGSIFEQALLPLLTSSSTISEARDKMGALFMALEGYYRNAGKNHPDAPLIWMAAHINWRGLQAFGDLSARI